jgi:hypothetical protein
MVADVNDLSAKSVNAVVPEVVGVTFTKELVAVLPEGPPEVYVPEVATSLLLLPNTAAVVAALKLALLVYNAIWKTSPEPFVKLCIPCISSCLNDVHI